MKSLLLLGSEEGGKIKTQMILMMLQIVPDRPCPSIIAPIIFGGKIAAYPNTPPCTNALKAPERTMIKLMITSADVQ